MFDYKTYPTSMADDDSFFDHLFEIFDEDNAHDLDSECTFCTKHIPNMERDKEPFCSRRCAVIHALYKLTGGAATQEDLDYVDTCASFLSDNSASVDIDPETQTAASWAEPRAGPVSATPAEHLEEAEDWEHELYISYLRETLERQDVQFGSGESSNLRTIGKLGNNRFDQNEGSVQASDDNAGKGVKTGAKREGNNRSYNVANSDAGVKGSKDRHDLNAEELRRLIRISLASRLKDIFTKNKNLRHQNEESDTRPDNEPSERTLSVLRSGIAILKPSERRKELSYIHRWLKKSGPGDSVDKPES